MEIHLLNSYFTKPILKERRAREEEELEYAKEMADEEDDSFP